MMRGGGRDGQGRRGRQVRYASRRLTPQGSLRAHMWHAVSRKQLGYPVNLAVGDGKDKESLCPRRAHVEHAPRLSGEAAFPVVKGITTCVLARSLGDHHDDARELLALHRVDGGRPEHLGVIAWLPVLLVWR